MELKNTSFPDAQFTNSVSIYTNPSMITQSAIVTNDKVVFLIYRSLKYNNYCHVTICTNSLNAHKWVIQSHSLLK